MIDKWFSRKITSYEEFRQFARDFRKFLNKNIPEGAEITRYRENYFYVSGFIRKGNKYVYFSTPDMRFGHLRWEENILIRKASNDEDYIGGENQITDCLTFKETCDILLKN